ncbi:hypothetical protein [Microlunatus soli]|uniref:DUF308 domain-containing protein n=1 Tax=Microlunatus soli TaxID=630515 RepID=A0A1H1PBK4_9ACTN|nr:hypothetical protein [Microlunatus soli]SDS08631.1 hypothetical protein SAMN04489812_0839 [Microlunatus soli]
MQRSRTRQQRADRRRRLEPFEKNATRLAVALVIAGPVLGLGAGMLGAAEIYPFEYATVVAIIVMCSLIGLALMIGAVGGLFIMGGPKAAPFGVVFVAGFGLLVAGLVLGDAVLRDLGVVLLAISGAVFYLVGFGSGDATPSAVSRWGHPIAVAAGLVVAVVGHLVGAWWLLLLGAMAFGCGLGVVIARWWYSRRPR